MRERPILFGGPMVRAILDGRKTQTRRVVKPRHDYIVDEIPDALGVYRVWPYFQPYVYAEPQTIEVPCPYGRPGDRLWVKETWGLVRPYDFTDWNRKSIKDEQSPLASWDLVYRADFGLGLPYRTPDRETAYWRPSIFMKRWASRITLEITDVRVERLHEISEADAVAEGVERAGGFMTTSGCWRRYTSDGPSCESPRESFRSLWESINGAGSWAANSWVWAISFRRLAP